MREACWGREQLETCSAVIAITGKLDVHTDASRLFAEAPPAVHEEILPMIGFEPAVVSGILGLPDNHIPVMLVVIGKRAGESRPRNCRFPLSEVVWLEVSNGASPG